MAEIQYREGRSSDAPSMTALAVQSYGQYKNELSEENFQKLICSVSDEQAMLDLISKSVSFVALFQEAIIGMAFLLPAGNPTEIYPDNWSYIRLLGVHPSWSGKGIATALSTRCIEKAKSSGESTIALHTSEFMDAARKVYERLGFEMLKAIPDRLGRKYWLYTKKIS